MIANPHVDQDHTAGCKVGAGLGAASARRTVNSKTGGIRFLRRASSWRAAVSAAASSEPRLALCRSYEPRLVCRLVGGVAGGRLSLPPPRVSLVSLFVYSSLVSCAASWAAWRECRLHAGFAPRHERICPHTGLRPPLRGTKKLDFILLEAAEAQKQQKNLDSHRARAVNGAPDTYTDAPAGWPASTLSLPGLGAHEKSRRPRRGRRFVGFSRGGARSSHARAPATPIGQVRPVSHRHIARAHARLAWRPQLATPTAWDSFPRAQCPARPSRAGIQRAAREAEALAEATVTRCVATTRSRWGLVPLSQLLLARPTDRALWQMVRAPQRHARGCTSPRLPA